MNTLWQDVRYAARMLAKRPAFTVVAVLTLALGIGATTALYSVLDAVMLRPLPGVAEPERLVVFTWRSERRSPARSHWGYALRDAETGKRSSGSFSYALFEEFRQADSGLGEVFAFFSLGRTNLQAGEQGGLAQAMLVSGGYFRGLGLRAWAGRLLEESDDAPGADPAAVLTHAYWQRRFGGDAEILGQVVFINGRPHTVVGVAPRGFEGTVDYAPAPDVFLPLSHLAELAPPRRQMLSDHGYWWVGVMGRLRPGVPPEQAQAALATVFHRYVDEWAPRDQGQASAEMPELVLRPGGQGQAEFRQRNKDTLLYALAVAGLVLLIACANVANLLLARAGERRREIAIRLALGSSRGGLVRQLWTESLLLSLGGGMLGVLLAIWVKELLFAWLPVSAVPQGLEIPLDLRVLAFTAGVSFLTALLFGLAPAWQATRVDLAGALKESAGRLTAGRLRQRLGKSLVVAQVALSVVVLVAAGLFVRTLDQLQRTPAGFDTAGVLTFRLDGSLSGYLGARLAGLYDEVCRRVGAIPGVRAVGMTRHPLFSGRVANTYLTVPGVERQIVYLHLVDGDLLGVLELPLLAGRALDARDHQESAPVAMVNQEFVRRFFPAGQALGQPIRFNPEEPAVEIIGVIPDVKYSHVREPAPPTVYLPARQRLAILADMTFLVRATATPEALAPAVTEALRALDPNLPVFELRSQDDLIRERIEPERETAGLSSLVGLLALLLAGIGLYGLMANAVAQRTNEMGIRMALGAGRGHIYRLVLGQGALLAALGIAAGLLGAFWLTPLVRSRLFGVTPADPLTFALAAAVLWAVALAACYVPARRATRVDPMVALRYE